MAGEYAILDSKYCLPKLHLEIPLPYSKKVGQVMMK